MCVCVCVCIYIYMTLVGLTLAPYGGWVVNATSRPLFTPGKESRYPLFRRLGGLQGRSGRVRKISPRPRSPDRPARNQSLYRLSYRGLPRNV